jgi:hypothetical protein
VNVPRTASIAASLLPVTICALVGARHTRTVSGVECTGRSAIATAVYQIIDTSLLLAVDSPAPARHGVDDVSY